MKKWEYKVMLGSGSHSEDEEELNKLGSDGWEAYSVVVSPLTSYPVFYLKKMFQID